MDPCTTVMWRLSWWKSSRLVLKPTKAPTSRGPSPGARVTRTRSAHNNQKKKHPLNPGTSIIIVRQSTFEASRSCDPRDWHPINNRAKIFLQYTDTVTYFSSTVSFTAQSTLGLYWYSDALYWLRINYSTKICLEYTATVMHGTGTASITWEKYATSILILWRTVMAPYL